MRVKHIHSSSKYNRSAASLSHALHKYVNAGAHIITLTEVENRARREAAARIKDYRLIAGHVNNRNDCDILIHNDFKVLYHENYKLSNLTFEVGGNTGPASYATIAVIQHKQSGKSFVVGVYHTPAGVESDLNDSKRPRVIAWWVNVRSLRKRVNHLKRSYRAKGAIICCDWNINYHRVWVKALIKTLFPAWKVSFAKHTPSGGTHGGRLIDWSVVKGFTIASAKLFSDDDSSDHRPYVEVLHL